MKINLCCKTNSGLKHTFIDLRELNIPPHVGDDIEIILPELIYRKDFLISLYKGIWKEDIELMTDEERQNIIKLINELNSDHHVAPLGCTHIL